MLGMRTALGFFVLVVALAPAGAGPQQSAGRTALASAIDDKISESRKLLRGWSWKQRIELRKAGDVVLRFAESASFTADGELLKTTIDEPPETTGRRKARRTNTGKKSRVGRVWRARLDELLESYLLPSRSDVREFVMQATIGPGDLAGTLRIRRRNVVRPNDELTAWVDADTKQLQRTRVFTELDGEFVAADVDYRPVEGGPPFEARRVVKVPGEKISMTIEKFNYVLPMGDRP